MSITTDDVKKVAKLSRLEVTEEEIPHLMRKMNQILDWFEMLNEPDTKDVKPMTAALENSRTRLRADETNDGGYMKDIMENAPESDHGFFVVPKVVE